MCVLSGYLSSVSRREILSTHPWGGKTLGVPGCDGPSCMTRGWTKLVQKNRAAGLIACSRGVSRCLEVYSEDRGHGLQAILVGPWADGINKPLLYKEWTDGLLMEGVSF
jgi:hypothetical protein